MCEINSKMITSVDSDDPLFHHILKIFDPVKLCDYHCEQCDWRPTGKCPAILRRLFLSLLRFLRVNITSPPTSEGAPEEFHQHGPLQEFERLDLSPLTPQLQRSNLHKASTSAARRSCTARGITGRTYMGSPGPTSVMMSVELQPQTTCTR